MVRLNEGTWYLKVMWKELGSTMIQVQELGRAVVVPGEREPSTVYKYCLHSGSEAGCKMVGTVVDRTVHVIL